jgi:hypothetical protein
VLHKTALVVLLLSTGAAQQQAPVNLDPVALLDLYAAGKYDEAIAQVKRADDQTARLLRVQWRTRGSEWIDAARPNHGARLLAAAGLVLETEALRVERGDWGGLIPPMDDRPQPCQGPCMIDWARNLLVERGLADAAAHAWYVAAIALVEGQRDYRYLYSAASSRDPLGGGRGLAQAALTEFPGDPQFRFARALAVASRFFITVDGGPGTGASADLIMISSFPNPPPPSAPAGTAPVVRAASAEFAALIGDEHVGIDAQIRLGYLHWATGDEAVGIDAWTAVTNRTGTSADQRYLAYFLLGWTALQRHEEDAARVAIDLALEARPNSQSAALVLAALDMRNGDGDSAHEVIVESLTKRPADDDPWRLFLYGRHPRLPAYIAALRKEIGQ